MTHQQIWAQDPELIRSSLKSGPDIHFFATDALPGPGLLETIAVLIVEPLGELIAWLETILSRHPSLSVYILSRTTPKEKVLEHCYRMGVKGIFTKEDREELTDMLQENTSPGAKENSVKVENPDWTGELRRYGFITQDERLYPLFESVRRVARTDATVLISGENGTGKEVVARIIHNLSPRSQRAFVAVHTGAIPENLLESELFGHVRGAFTSAIKDRKGKFEASHGGTIFLDEISTMPAALQVKLLRVLQNKQFERVGDNQLVRADVRIVSATNVDLLEMVGKGLFREDLYYRLNVVPIHIPPLRERLADIAILATYFVDLVCAKYSIPHKKFALGAIRLLQRYNWPGNVRQLENIVERMIVLNPEVTVFMPRHVPQEVMVLQSPSQGNGDVGSEVLENNGLSLPEWIRNIEKRLILDSLQKTQWNKQQAARMLKIKRTTLIEKMKRLEENHEE